MSAILEKAMAERGCISLAKPSSAMLEALDHAPESLVLTGEQQAAVDDMADFAAKAKGILTAEFSSQGWGNTAASELADIHIGAMA